MSQRQRLEEQRGATGRRGVHGQVEGNAALALGTMVTRLGYTVSTAEAIAVDGVDALLF